MVEPVLYHYIYEGLRIVSFLQDQEDPGALMNTSFEHCM